MRGMNRERGGILVLVGISMTLLFGIAALTIDHGHNLSERRQLMTATDAAALAAADAYGQAGTGCNSVASDFLTRNSTRATLTNCQAYGDTVNGTYGWVVVSAEVAVNQYFAHLLGYDTVVVASTSTAVFGAPQSTYFGGLRPMSLCLPGLESIDEYQDWLNGNPNDPSAEIRVTYSKEHPADCGSTTGNWGFIDFDGGGNSNQDTISWIQNGYEGELVEGWYEGDPGAISGSHRSALTSLVNSGEVFWLPLVTDAQGNGANTEFYITEPLAIRLTGFKVSGKQSKRYLEFVIEPLALVADITCCGVADPDDDRRTTGLFLLDDSGTPIGANS